MHNILIFIALLIDAALLVFSILMVVRTAKRQGYLICRLHMAKASSMVMQKLRDKVEETLPNSDQLHYLEHDALLELSAVSVMDDEELARQAALYDKNEGAEKRPERKNHAGAGTGFNQT